MRAGIEVVRIKSKSGRLPDWPHDEAKARKDKAKIKRFERRMKRENQ